MIETVGVAGVPGSSFYEPRDWAGRKVRSNVRQASRDGCGEAGDGCGQWSANSGPANRQPWPSRLSLPRLTASANSKMPSSSHGSGAHLPRLSWTMPHPRDDHTPGGTLMPLKVSGCSRSRSTLVVKVNPCFGSLIAVLPGFEARRMRAPGVRRSPRPVARHQFAYSDDPRSLQWSSGSGARFNAGNRLRGVSSCKETSRPGSECPEWPRRRSRPGGGSR